MENAKLRVVVAPELSGRAVQMIDKETGKDVLRRPDPGEWSYPDSGGWAVFAYSDYLEDRALEAKWELEAQSEPHELALISTYANGLKARRGIRLQNDEPEVHTETVLENAGTSVLDVVIQSRCEVDPGSMDRVAVTFRNQDGKTVEKKLIQPGEEPTGSAVYEGKEQPDGEWTLSGVGTVLALSNRFPKE